MVSDSRGMSEFGIVAGGGLVACMLSSIIVLPALLSLRDRWRLKRSNGRAVASRVEFRFLGNLSGTITRHPRKTLIGGLTVTAVMVYLMLGLTFDYNYLNMEPKGLLSIKLQDKMIEAYDISPDFVLVTAGSVDEARRITDGAKDFKSVGQVESISEYLPSAEQQNDRQVYVEQIRDNLANAPEISYISSEMIPELIEQIDRLGMNMIELADLAYLGGQDRVDHKASLIVGKAEDTLMPNLVSSVIATIEKNPEGAVLGLNKFQNDYYPALKSKSVQMANSDEITLETLPVSIVEKYADVTGDNFLVTIYPRQQVWDYDFLERFANQMKNVSDRITGIPPLFLRMIVIVSKEGKIATVLALAVVFVLLWVDFRSPRYAMLAMIPLVIGSIWMLGLLKLCGLQLTMLNVMAVPLIVGIGIDDGVHVLHRYRREGKGSIITVMKSTGRAVLITSLTTMIAFGSFVFATYRGLGSMGKLLFLGVAACFLTTVLLITAIITINEKRNSN
jgi:predicted RND superfamily exporter protein